MKGLLNGDSLKNKIYCLKLNERQVRELISDVFADIGGNYFGQEFYIKYIIEFENKDNGDLCAQCLISICNEANESTMDNGEYSVRELVSKYHNSKINFIHFCVGNEVLLTNIKHSLNWKIKGKPKKPTKFFTAQFYGTLGNDLRCVVCMSNTVITEDILKKIDKVTLFADSLNDLKYIKYLF